MTTSSPLEESPARMIVSTPAKPTTRPSARSAVTRSSSASLPITRDEERRRVEQDRRDRRPGADRALGEPGERERRAAEAHRRRRIPTGAACAAGASRTARRNGSRTRKPSAPRENAVKAGVVCSQRDLGDAERRAPEDHRDEQQQRNRDACAKTSHRRRETTLFRPKGLTYSGRGRRAWASGSAASTASTSGTSSSTS